MAQEDIDLLVTFTGNAHMAMTKIGNPDQAFLTADTKYPAFSFFFRLHSGSEKQIHDAAHIRNRCHETFKEAGLPASQLELLEKKADQLIEQLDFQSGAKSIGLFISEATAHAESYYVNIPERQYVGEFFSPYEALYARQESAPYLLFVLEPATVRVLKGQGNHLQSLTSSESLDHLLSVFKRRSPVQADKDGKVRSGHEYDSKWQGELTKALNAVCAANRLPAFVVGLNETGLNEADLARDGIDVLAAINEVHQPSDSEKLKSLTEQLIKLSGEKNVEKWLAHCGTALGAKKLANGLDEILSCAKEGRGETLVIESPSWETVAKSEFSKLHEAIREMIVKHGKVEFVPEGTLSQWNGIALILRY